MERWDGKNILDLARSIVEEDYLPEEEQHIEFSTGDFTFRVLKSVLEKDLKRLQKSPFWPEKPPENLVHYRVLSTPDSQGNGFAQARLNLSAVQVDQVSLILRIWMGGVDKPNSTIIEQALNDLNTDFQLAGGIMGPAYRDYLQR